MVDYSNREFVLKAVTENGYSLYHAHDDFKKDRIIALVAISNTSYAINFIDDSLKNDEEFLYEVDQINKIYNNSYIFRYINKRIQIEIRKNPNYLLDFAPVYLKPAKR
jgi:hypothetical protein